MARDNYTFGLTCSCGATGVATGTDNDNGPNFTVDGLPDDFKSNGHSPNPWAQRFRHNGCGGSVSVEVGTE